jgi:biotin carboxyl carrier protein
MYICLQFSETMNKITIDNQLELEVTNIHDQMLVGEKALSWDMQLLPDGSYSILAGGRSYRAMVERIDRDSKTMNLRIEGREYSVSIREPLDQLLQKMGLNMSTSKKAESIKAPMPGLVLKIMVEAGQEIKKGDPVLILEAMKMENVFKAQSDARVKAIRIEERKAVEKGEVLIELE